MKTFFSLVFTFVFFYSLHSFSHSNYNIGDGEVDFFIEDATAISDLNVCFKILVTDFENISKVQIPLKWNPNKMTNPQINNEALLNSSLVLSNPLGSLRYSWEDTSGANPISLVDNQILMEVCFLVVGEIGEISCLDIKKADTPPPVFDVLLQVNDSTALDYTVKPGCALIQQDTSDVSFFYQESDFGIGFESCVDIRVWNFKSIKSFQFAMDFQTTKFVYKNPSNLNANLPITLDNINLNSLGNIQINWADMTNNGVDIPNGDIIFSLCFDTKLVSPQSTKIEFTNNITGGVLVINSADEMIIPELISSDINLVNVPCSASSMVPAIKCINSEIILLASVDAGTPGATTFPVKGNWLINDIAVLNPGTNQGLSGSKYDVNEVNDTNFDDFKQEVKLSFKSSKPYKLSYYLNFNSCVDTIEFGNLNIDPLPTLPSIIPLDTICFNENAILKFSGLDENPKKLTYNFKGADKNTTITQVNDSIIFSNITASGSVKFVELVDNITTCKNTNLSPSLINLFAYKELKATLDDEICSDTSGTYNSIFKLEGGSGNFELLSSKPGGILNGDIYSTPILPVGQNDTIQIFDLNCNTPKYVFPLENNCGCRDTAAVYNSEIYEACSKDIITLKLISNSKTSITNPIFVLRIFENSTGKLLKERTFADDNIKIEFDPIFEDGKEYFARNYITIPNSNNNQPNFDYFCIDSAAQQIRFRFFHNPDNKIQGLDEVCSQQKDVLYQVSKIENNNKYIWNAAGASNFAINNDKIYVNFGNSGDASISLIETYKPQISTTNISCANIEQHPVKITEDVAVEKIAIIFFEPLFLIADISGDYCYEWEAVHKLTGAKIQGPLTREWIVPDFDTLNYVYICIIGQKFNGICVEDEYCKTYNFFNSLGPISNTEDSPISSIILYPNPASNYLNISFAENSQQNLQVIIRDLNGMVLLKDRILYQGTYSAYVGDLKPGFYFVEIQDEHNNHKIIRKISIQ